jgi:hypothetical protein
LHLHIPGIDADRYSDSYSAAKSDTNTDSSSEAYTHSAASPDPGTAAVASTVKKKRTAQSG